jgi:hypothetical protein
MPDEPVSPPPTQAPAVDPVPAAPVPAGPAPQQYQPAPVAPAPDTSGQEIDLTETLTWGNNQQASLNELIQARDELKNLKAQGADTYTQAMSGDVGAAKRYLETLEQSTHARPAPDPNQQQQAPQQASPEGWDEVQQFVGQMRQREIREGINRFLQTDQFKVLSDRPGIVDDIITRLHVAQKTMPQGQSITGGTVRNMLEHLATQEKQYQSVISDRIKKETIGSMGVGEPFRGGAPQERITEKPGYNDPNYKKWLSQRFQDVRRGEQVATEASNLGQ